MNDIINASEKNKIVPFGYDDQLVRTVMVDDVPWFVAKDVCNALELSNPTESLKTLDDDEKNTLRVSEGILSKRGNPNMNIINESGLYTLILRSNKPEAKRFRKWVTSEVLPSIRKTGAYGVPQNLFSEISEMKKMLEALKAGQKQLPVYINPASEMKDVKSAMLHFGGKCLEITKKDSDYVDAITVFKLFKNFYDVEINSFHFMREFPSVFVEISCDTRRKNHPLFRGCKFK